MAELIAKSPCDGLLPVSYDSLTLSEMECGHITSVAPFRGKENAVSEALKEGHGMSFPKPNRSTEKSDARAIWVGQGQAFLVGPEPVPALIGIAALTDQSDAWTIVRLEGEQAADALARLVPVDLRAETFKRGHTARSQLMHMPVSITNIGKNTFQIMTFRSMAATAVHDLKTAMASVTSRG